MSEKFTSLDADITSWCFYCNKKIRNEFFFFFFQFTAETSEFVYTLLYCREIQLKSLHYSHSVSIISLYIYIYTSSDKFLAVISKHDCMYNLNL